MAKYLIRANYTVEGLKGLLKEGGSGRRAAIEKLLGSVGGKVDAFYYAFGDADVYVLADLPNNVTTAAVSMIVTSAGAASTSVTVLLTPEEVDEAVKMHPSYRPPGA